MALVPEELVLENFMIVRERTTIHFPNQVPLGLFGESGAGKSTIPEAVGFLATGQVRGRKKGLGALVHTGEKSAYVALVLRDERGRYRLSKRIQKAGTGASVQYLVEIDDNGFTPVPNTGTATEYHEYIERRFGLTEATVQGLVLLMQNRTAELLNAQPKQQRDLFSEMANVGIYGAMYQEVMEERKRVRKELDKIALSLEEKEPWEGIQEESLQKSLDDLVAGLRSLRMERDRAIRTEEAAKKAHALRRRLEDLREHLDRAESLAAQIDQARQRLQVAEVAHERLPKIQAWATAKEAVERAASDHSRIRDDLGAVLLDLRSSRKRHRRSVTARAEALARFRLAADEVARTKGTMDRLTGYRERYATRDELAREIGRLRGEIEDHEALEAQLPEVQDLIGMEGVVARGQSVLERIRLLLEKKKTNQALQKNLSDTGKQIDEGFAELDRRLDEAERDEKEARQAKVDLQGTIEGHVTALAEVTGRLGEHQLDDGVHQCPVCIRPLGPGDLERLEALRLSLAEEAASRKKDLAASRARMAELDQAIEQSVERRKRIEGNRELGLSRRARHQQEVAQARDAAAVLEEESATLRKAVAGVAREIGLGDLPFGQALLAQVNGRVVVLAERLKTQGPLLSAVLEARAKLEVRRPDLRAAEHRLAQMSTPEVPKAELPDALSEAERALDAAQLARSESEAAAEKSREQEALEARQVAVLEERRKGLKLRLGRARRSLDEFTLLLQERSRFFEGQDPPTPPEIVAMEASAADLQDARAFHAEVAASGAKLDELRARITEEAAALAEIGEVGDPAAAEAALEVLTAQVRTMEAQEIQWRDTLRDIAARRQERDELLEDRARLEPEAARLDLLTEAFGPKGLQSRILKIVVPDVIEVANEVLVRLMGGGMELAVDIDDDTDLFRILYRDSDTAEEYWSTYLMSGGQSIRAGIALSLGLSEYWASRKGGRRLHLLVLDEGFGSLPKADRRLLFDELRRQEQAIGKLVVISHIDEVKRWIPHAYQFARRGGRAVVTMTEDLGEHLQDSGVLAHREGSAVTVEETLPLDLVPETVS